MKQGCVYVYNSGGGGKKYEQGCVYVYNSGGGGVKSMNRGVSMFIIVEEGV